MTIHLMLHAITVLHKDKGRNHQPHSRGYLEGEPRFPEDIEILCHVLLPSRFIPGHSIQCAAQGEQECQACLHRCDQQILGQAPAAQGIKLV